LRQCEKAKIGTSMPSRSQSSVRMDVFPFDSDLTVFVCKYAFWTKLELMG
jgi:hypothetical protein